MKIEVGKFYKTRNGRKAFVGYKTPFTSAFEFPYRGITENDISCSWDEEGDCGNLQTDNMDLAEEWKEPEVREVIAYLLREDTGKVTVEFEDGIPYGNTVIGSIKIVITEGEFADERNDMLLAGT